MATRCVAALPLRPKPLRDKEQAQQADQQRHMGILDKRGRGPAKRDPGDPGGQQQEERAAVIDTAIGEQPDQVHHHQDRQQDAGRLHRRNGQRHQRNRQHADGTAEATLRQAGEHHGRHGQGIKQRVSQREHEIASGAGWDRRRVSPCSISKGVT